MLTRRLVLAAAASALALGTTVAAHAADWKTQIPEITFALVPAENAADFAEKYPGLTIGRDTLESIDRYVPQIVGPKVGRNEPCPCGSGKKYKKCHGA